MESDSLRGKLSQLVQTWQTQGLPSREALLQTAETLTDWKRQAGSSGLWASPPKMVTATLDDGWGQGLALISRYAQIAGLALFPLGLLCPPETVIAQCRRIQPALLGLTVLQFDSEEMIARIRQGLPAHTRIVAGGPVFKADPEFAERAGIDGVATDLAAFLAFLLDYAARR